jgi:hypothetical protein
MGSRQAYRKLLAILVLTMLLATFTPLNVIIKFTKAQQSVTYTPFSLIKKWSAGVSLIGGSSNAFGYPWFYTTLSNKIIGYNLETKDEKTINLLKVGHGVLCSNDPVFPYFVRLAPNQIAVGNGWVAVAPHYGYPLIVAPDLSTYVNLSSVPKADYSYWLATDGSTIYWLSNKGLIAFDSSGKVLWSSDAVSNGMFSISGSNLLVATGRSFVVISTAGSVVQTFNVPAISTSPEGYVGLTNGTLMQYSSGQLTKLINVGGAINSIKYATNGEVLLATSKGLVLANNSKVLSTISGDFRTVAYDKGFVIAGSSQGVALTYVKGDYLIQPYWGPTKMTVNWVSIYGVYVGVTYAMSLTELYVIAIPDPEDSLAHFKAIGTWTKELSTTINGNSTIPISIDTKPGVEPEAFMQSLTVTPTKIVATNLPTSLLRSPNSEPWYFNLETQKNIVVGTARLAYAQGFWNIQQQQVISGGLSIQTQFKMDAYWNPPPAGVIVSESVPTGVGAVYWLDTPTIDLNSLDTLKITAQFIKPGTTKMPSDMVFQDLIGTVTFGIQVGYGVHTIFKNGLSLSLPTRATKTVQYDVDRVWAELEKESPYIAEDIDSIGEKYTEYLYHQITIHDFAKYLAELEVKAVDVGSGDLLEAVYKAAEEAGIQEEVFLMSNSLFARSSPEVPSMVGYILSVAQNVPSDVLTDGGYSLSRTDINNIINNLGNAFGSTTDVAGAMGSEIVKGLSADGLIENGKVSFFDVLASVEYPLEVATYAYLRQQKNVPISNAEAIAKKLKAYIETATISEVGSGQSPFGSLPSQITVNPTSFKTNLASELTKLGVPESKAVDIVNSIEPPNIVIVQSDKIRVNFVVKSSWQGVVADLFISLGTYLLAKGVVLLTGSTVAGAAVLIGGAMIFGLQYTFSLLNDVLLGNNRQGASVTVGFAFLSRFVNGSEKVVVMADVPDVSLEAIKPWGLQDIKGWLEQGLDAYVRNAGYSGAVLSTSIPNGDFKSALTSFGISTVEKIGVFMFAVAWRQLPYYTQPQTTGSFEGVVIVQNLNIEGLRIKNAQPSADEVARLLGGLKLWVAGSYFKPTVSSGSATFTVSSATNFVPAPVVTLGFSDDWQGYFVVLNISANVWIIQHFQNYSGNLIADMRYDGDGMVKLQEFDFVALPNKDPLKIGTMVWFKDGPRTLDVPLNKFAMVPRLDGLRDYKTTEVEYFDPGNGKRYQFGEHRLYYVIYNSSAMFLNDTSVTVLLNGTTNLATLPSVATAYIDSPAKQNVGLSMTYKIEIEANKTWNVVEEGTLLTQTVSFASAGRKSVSADISGVVSRLVDKVRKLSESGMLVVRADITPEVDSFPANNWDEATVPISPALVSKLLSSTQNATLIVKVVNITNAVISGANVNITGAVFRSGTTNSTGQITFDNIPSGVYVVSASANGYASASRSLLVNGTSTITLSLAPVGYVKAPQYQGNSTLPPYQPPSGPIKIPLEVKVTYKDGYPVAGASVYVNSILAGRTDSWGTWSNYYDQGTQVTVQVKTASWTSNSRTVKLDQGELLVFVAPTLSNVSLPEVGAQWVDVVYTRGRVPATYAIMFKLFSTVKQNVTVKAGLMFDNKTVFVYNTTTVTFTDRGIVTSFVFVDITQNVFTALRPFVNITSYQYDTDPSNNLLIGGLYKFSPQLELTVGIYLEVLWGNIKGILYPGDTKISATVFVISTRDVDFVNELNTSINLQINKTTIIPEASPIAEQKSAKISSLKAGNTTITTLNFTLPFARVVNITASLPVLTELDMSHSGAVAYSPIVIPPHFIVMSGSVETPTAKVGDTIKVKVTAWSNAYSNELPEVTPYFTIENVPVSGLSRLPLKAGTHDYEVSTIVPNVTLPVYQPYKTANVTLFMAATPDVLPGDNFYKASILLYNASSWQFWLIVGVAVIIGILLILALIKALKVAMHTIEEEEEKRMKFVKKKPSENKFVHRVEEERTEPKHFVHEVEHKEDQTSSQTKKKGKFVRLKQVVEEGKKKFVKKKEQ